jgi:hypothetical protein
MLQPHRKLRRHHDDGLGRRAGVIVRGAPARGAHHHVHGRVKSHDCSRRMSQVVKDDRTELFIRVLQQWPGVANLDNSVIPHRPTVHNA